MTVEHGVDILTDFICSPDSNEDARRIRFIRFSGCIAGTYRCDSRDVSRVGGDIGIPGGNEKSHKTGIKNDRSIFLITSIVEKTK